MSGAALALFGGVLIGISGILHGLLMAPASDRAWRIAFLARLMGAGSQP